MEKNYDNVARYTKVIRLKPDDAYAYDNSGDAYHKNGDYDNAIIDYTEAIRLDPKYATSKLSSNSLYRQELRMQVVGALRVSCDNRF